MTCGARFLGKFAARHDTMGNKVSVEWQDWRVFSSEPQGKPGRRESPAPHPSGPPAAQILADPALFCRGLPGRATRAAGSWMLPCPREAPALKILGRYEVCRGGWKRYHHYDSLCLSSGEVVIPYA